MTTYPNKRQNLIKLLEQLIKGAIHQIENNSASFLPRQPRLENPIRQGTNFNPTLSHCPHQIHPGATL